MCEIIFMKRNNRVLIFLGLVSTICAVNTANANLSCTWKPGSEANPSVEIGSATNLVGVNNGQYPSPVNFALANITTAPYGGAAPQWGMICTAPIKVTPRLFMVRSPDTRFSGYPYLQDTNNTPFYSIEMAYTTPNGEKLNFGQVAAGQSVYGTPFILAEHATPANPVEINLRSLNINSVSLQGYQTGPATRSSTVWGTGGTLNDIFFNFIDRDATQLSSLNVNVRLFIYEIGFTVKTCAVESGDRNKTISLGEKSGQDFSGSSVGGVTNSVNFKISLKCQQGAAVTYKIDTSTPDTSNPTQGLIQLTGSDAAIGYALQLRSLPFQQSSGNYEPVKFGVNVPATTAATGNISSDFINFDARYYRTLPISQAKPGTANATATIEVNYQ